MSENLPYEDEVKKRLEELVLPAEDIAWNDMKQRLDKEDDNRPLIPPFFKGCAGYGILFILMAIALLFIIDPAKWFHNINKKQPVKNDSIAYKIPMNKHGNNNTGPLPGDSSVHRNSLKDSITLSQKVTGYSTLLNDTPVDESTVLKTTLPGSSMHKGQDEYPGQRRTANSTQQKDTVDAETTNQPSHAVKKIPARIKATTHGDGEVDRVASENKNQTGIHQPGTLQADTTNVIIKTPARDSLKKKSTDTTAKKNVAKIDSIKSRHIYFGAGLALHQLLPVAGQKSNPYNSLGRKSSLSDYIPAVYVRLYKNKKWFIQSEFRYGAPQYTKNIVFNLIKKIDSSGTSVTAESKSVKKTFYHQLPISFNYFVLPGLSAGAGITFNKFSSAIVQEDIHKSNTITQTDTLISSGVVTQKKADSNFVKTYMQALFEIQYKWKRFSAGARYSFGLQPYLEFTLPGGIERREKNSSLQLFIRFELWNNDRE